MAKHKTMIFLSDFHRLSFRLFLYIVAVLCCAVLADEEYTAPVHGGRLVRQRRQSPEYERRGPINRRLRIVTINHEPYTIISGSGEKMTFSGFIPDIIHALAQRMHFRYDFYEATEHGVFENGYWTGMIGEVVKNDATNGQDGADLAAGAITITSARENAVDFLKPFQHGGISAIVRRPEASLPQTPFTFGIFQPLQPAVWGLILLSTLVVGLFLWTMNMYNPYEWGGRHGLGLADSHHAEMFNLPGSLWFVFTSLQWQGFERAPRSIASKFVGCVWFAFVTIVVVTYTAGIVNNLYWASMVTRSNPNPIRPRYIDLGHAIQSGTYKYGTIRDSHTYRYIMDVAKGDEFDAIRRYWRSPEGQEQLVSNVAEGLGEVRDGRENYIFLMESLLAKYHANQRPCDLVTIGESFGTRSYGFAVAKNMSYNWSDDMHRAIMELMETGEIEALERRWFTDSSQCWNVTVVERVVNDAISTLNVLNVNQPRDIDVATFTGPLVLVIVGLIIGVGIAIAEMMYYRKLGRYQSGNRPQGHQLGMDPDDGNI